jgi:hypothetical protein
MTIAQSKAYRVRWFLLAAGLLCWLAGLFYLLNCAWPGWEVFPGAGAPDERRGWGLQGVMGWSADTQWGYCVAVGVYFGVFLLTQWLLLCPRGRLRVGVQTTGRPMILSVLSAGLMGAILTVGLLASVLELAGQWQRFAGRAPDLEHYWPSLVALAIAWTIWAVLFFTYWRQGDHYTWAGRVLRGLFAGSILELLVAAPAHVFAVRHEKESCYCELGSYTGLVLGGTVLLWCFGPGVVLLFLREKRRRQELLGAVQP